MTLGEQPRAQADISLVQLDRKDNWLKPQYDTYICRQYDYADIQLRDMPEACSLLRSARSIHGFDIIVMNGQKDDALKQLASNKKAFGTDGRGTWEETI